MRLEVFYLGRGKTHVIGQLSESKDGKVFFEYNPEWTARGMELSPIYLPNSLQDQVSTPTPEFSILHGLFADSLPDWWGQQMMKRYFYDVGIPWHRVSALQKLACTGAHAMGAIGYQPPASGTTFREELTVEVAELVNNAHSFVLGNTDEMLPGLLRSGLSSGGAEPKVLLGFNKDFSKAMAGGGSLPEGFDRWLLKFDLDPEYARGREEYAFSLMAQSAGISMTETKILPGPGDTFHFLTKRFDRVGQERRHVHTYSGITHTAVRDGLDYADLMELTRALTGNKQEIEEVFLRACFNVLSGNDDDHARNHAFLMDTDGQWSISPAYDLTCTSNPLASGIRSAGINGRKTNLQLKHLRGLGKTQNIKKVDDIIERALTAIKSWPHFAQKAGMKEYRTQQISEDMPGYTL